MYFGWIVLNAFILTVRFIGQVFKKEIRTTTKDQRMNLIAFVYFYMDMIHLLSKMHVFKAIWLVSSRLPEHCQCSHLTGRIGLWRLFSFILPCRFLSERMLRVWILDQRQSAYDFKSYMYSQQQQQKWLGWQRKFTIKEGDSP